MTSSRKRRTGCEQCKRRKVGCDEKQPACSRCAARGETCTGNFISDQWQIERPWLWNDSRLEGGAVLENSTLRHWYDSACLNMAIFRPPTNPLSHDITAWLRHSKALRHTLESIAEAHHQGFSPDSLNQSLRIRGLAISSLSAEVARIQRPSPKQQVLQRTIILSSLMLCISSSWVDPLGKDFGMEFLAGVHSVTNLLAASEPTDGFSFYILGLYLYCMAFSSYLTPAVRQILPSPSVISAFQRPPFSESVHPVMGIATTLCPLITEIGHYYRRVLDTRISCDSTQQNLQRRLQVWHLPPGSPQQPQLLELAEGYRALSTIMLFQAKAAVTELHEDEILTVLDKVLGIMNTLKHIPDEDPLLNWVGPLLVVAGSELPDVFLEERNLVQITGIRLATWTRVPTYSRALEVVREVWRWRDMGVRITWLESC
ncbi:fungal-specific transcription factor domain-containing protein [Ilyonectria robusta]|uniref:fungal-specific transcription factor domain-containing protein n=1 Tax=Ilyonectria robusta TaxID=1079257 RepID=UPI001E8E5211|nr:fungal-specific transcription factor domain-containing protein [Ilyonectria robusta]KAH8666183.1 fungal-specific transcription factor domain-containing protein [Ilyonectria robusta]